MASPRGDDEAPHVVLPICEALGKVNVKDANATLESILKRRSSGKLHCEECKEADSSNLWLNLQVRGASVARDGSVGVSLVVMCGRSANRHMMKHWNEHPEAATVLNLGSGQVWDYVLDCEVLCAVEAAELEKTGEHLVGYASAGDADSWLSPMCARVRPAGGDEVVDDGRRGEGVEGGGGVGGEAGEGEVDSDEEGEEGVLARVQRGRVVVSGAGLAGLQNLGNTCYLNAALQALSNIPLVARTLGEVPFYAVNPGSPSRPSIPIALQDFVEEQWFGSRTTLSGHFVLQQVRRNFPMFHGYHQQDAQEALKFMLMNAHDRTSHQLPLWMVDDLPALRSIKPGVVTGEVGGSAGGGGGEGGGDGAASSSSSSSSDVVGGVMRHRMSSSQTAAWRSRAWLKKGPLIEKPTAERSPISDAFRGVLVSRVRCRTCAYESTTLDHFYDLSLPIPDSPHPRGTSPAAGAATRATVKARGFGPPHAAGSCGSCFSCCLPCFGGAHVSVNDCLQRFCDADPLTGTDQFACPKCKEKRDADKAMAIAQAPPVLCLHLKRFAAGGGGWAGKVSTFVQFPLENLDLAPFVFPETEQCARENVEERVERRRRAAAAAMREAKAFEEEVALEDGDGEGDESESEKEGASTAGVSLRRKSSLEATSTPPKVPLKRASSVAPASTPSLVLRGGADPPILSDTPYSDIIADELVSVIERARAMGTEDPTLSGPFRYDLVSVVQHIGMMGGGHYVAYGRRRTDKKWYHFNDSSVTEIAPGRVAAKEAYLLFYVRRPRIQPPKLPRPPASLKTPFCFVSRSWWLRLQSGTDPGPVTAAEVACPHGYLRQRLLRHEDPLLHVMPITKEQATILVKTYGRQDALIPHPLQACPRCKSEAKSLRLRRRHELRAIQSVDTKHVDRDRGDEDGCWYLMDARWLDKWNSFVNQAEDRIADDDPTGTLRGLLPPTPVDNSRLLKANGEPRKGLRPVVHYRGVNGKVWRFFMRTYGGGPMLRRRKIDIYSEPVDMLPREILGEVFHDEPSKGATTPANDSSESAKSTASTPKVKRRDPAAISPSRSSRERSHPEEEVLVSPLNQ